MSSFPSEVFYIKNNELYLDIETEKTELNQYRIILSEKKNDRQLWYYDKKDKLLKHYKTNGHLIFQYRGWIPYRSNIFLQTEMDYDIHFTPLEIQYIENELIINEKYILLHDDNLNIIIEEKNDKKYNDYEEFNLSILNTI